MVLRLLLVELLLMVVMLLRIEQLRRVQRIRGRQGLLLVLVLHVVDLLRMRLVVVLLIG